MVKTNCNKVLAGKKKSSQWGVCKPNNWRNRETEKWRNGETGNGETENWSWRESFVALCPITVAIMAKRTWHINRKPGRLSVAKSHVDIAYCWHCGHGRIINNPLANQEQIHRYRPTPLIRSDPPFIQSTAANGINPYVR